MTAYIVAHLTINNPEKYGEYAQKVAPTLAPYNGEAIVIGEVAKILEGEHQYKRVVVLKFPDQSNAEEWYQSEAYQQIIGIRKQSSDAELILVSS